jgi:hypothetical protein
MRRGKLIGRWTPSHHRCPRERGITVGRSQVRRVLLVEGVRWRNPHPWGESHYLRSCPKRTRVLTLYIKEPENATTICLGMN